MAAVTHSAAFTSRGLNIASGGAMTVNYGASIAAGDTVVIAHVNSIENGSQITAASDNAGNSYFVFGRTSSTEGPSSLIVCTLHTAVTSSNVITFTKTTGQQLCVLSGRVFSGSKLVPVSAGNSGETTGATWTATVSATYPTGIAVSMYAFSQDWTFTAPTTSPSGSTFVSWYDGGNTYQCAVGVAYATISATGSKSVQMTGTASAAAYTTNSVLLQELPRDKTIFLG